ncbi:GxxExxY protein [Caulobacter sp. KR2-114]|uniref:GxxExxY protein n=1 Tax=Caulobacter sp. KR2-114 TaxID=3400912 RepID=UPI003C005ACB
MQDDLNHEPHEPHERVLFREEVFRIQGAVFEVNRVMGGGFLEAVYQECLAIEFAARAIPFKAKPGLAIVYKGVTLAQAYVPDFLCFDGIIVELKVARDLAPEHRAQVINYLKATGLRLGLLVNFPPGSKARIERLAV